MRVRREFTRKLCENERSFVSLRGVDVSLQEYNESLKRDYLSL